MNTLIASPEQAKSGIKVTTEKKTIVEVRTASLELLIGGAYGDHRYGHTALRINVGLLERVYDYGRYGLHAGPIGQGVLRIWNKFQPYIDDENALLRITTGFMYEISKEKAREIIKSFNEKTTGKSIKIKTDYFESYVIDTYNALGPNCTTVSIDATKIALPNIDKDWRIYQKGRGLDAADRKLVDAKGWPNYIFMPADLLEMLDKAKPPCHKRKMYKK